MTRSLQCVVVTPEQTLRDTRAQFVSVTLEDGELGIAPAHSPLLGRLGCGEMRITTDGKVDHYFVEGGFVEVLHDVVSILTPRAIAAEDLDEFIVAAELERARSQEANTPELVKARNEAITRGQAMLRVARHSGI